MPTPNRPETAAPMTRVTQERIRTPMETKIER